MTQGYRRRQFMKMVGVAGAGSALAGTAGGATGISTRTLDEQFDLGGGGHSERIPNPPHPTRRAEGASTNPQADSRGLSGSPRRGSGDRRSPVITRRHSRLERPHGGVLALQGGEDVKCLRGFVTVPAPFERSPAHRHDDSRPSPAGEVREFTDHSQSVAATSRS